MNTAIYKSFLTKSVKVISTFKNATCVRGVHISSERLKAQIIDGVKIAKDIRRELKVEVDEWIARGNKRPHLTALLVGEDPASATYVKNKMQAAREIGIESRTLKVPPSVTQNELLDHIQFLNGDSHVDGILVQLPLPKHITERAICNAIAPHKDVDGFNIVNVGRFCLDMNTLIPCTPLGVQELIKRTGVKTFGKHAVVCGRSKNVGMPIAMLLHADGLGETSAMDATTTICHRYTPPDQLALLTRSADIIVTAAGVPNLIRADMVKPGACIIDVGITRIHNKKTGKSKLVGDVDFEAVSEVAGYITPVPGGVGPMTVAMLMRNTLIAAKKSVVYNILEPGAVVHKEASQLRP
ncbi:bifunctional methylenetetrahydrofolate dehydrogenase/cyclohydrolase, mitochondrial [Zootermopsis nevadensis]|uniref:methenyltetrahydrofolate cyclohydrolase n=1 Tax=Zootermopsis nevadensis TaxID=136037 RepID=A0A067RE48_ZOONE|nr:bifunctional methylenetetrahydrofolate dehydrogenase/cyclohydrolase, mitochondrial [Zootermopsis nevadensis]KDR21308.1 Bifunctional methylenetetrahydrofolate dehydrogenase/cyclohydrolase, mitochondrial [Zootermopsis nevadensis]